MPHSKIKVAQMSRFYVYLMHLGIISIHVFSNEAFILYYLPFKANAHVLKSTVQHTSQPFKAMQH